jgi:hypothetical protein
MRKELPMSNFPSAVDAPDVVAAAVKAVARALAAFGVSLVTFTVIITHTNGRTPSRSGGWRELSPAELATDEVADRR